MGRTFASVTRRSLVAAGAAASLIGMSRTASAQLKLGARIHGGFGPFIPVGIRIGLDALTRLKAEPRTVTVTYFSGEKAPCPCIADGVMIATQASPGQGTLRVASEKAPAGLLAVIEVRERKGNAGVTYTIKDEWLPKLLDWIKTQDPMGRYQAAMAAEGLFEVVPSR
jgi:formylmethanofuran dehydrogenase subunit E